MEAMEVRNRNDNPIMNTCVNDATVANRTLNILQIANGYALYVQPYT
jgi:hypothetical protein